MRHALLPKLARCMGAALCSAMACGPTWAADTTAAQQLSYWSAQAGSAGNADKGKTFFSSRHGGEWSCASCHGTPPTTRACAVGGTRGDGRCASVVTDGGTHGGPRGDRSHR